LILQAAEQTLEVYFDGHHEISKARVA
jgi:hypothetical protein